VDRACLARPRMECADMSGRGPPAVPLAVALGGDRVFPAVYAADIEIVDPGLAARPWSETRLITGGDINFKQVIKRPARDAL